jgi:CRISPR/Cas system endoribonuclease Cas6 (RAMP superfamily)
VKAALTVEGLRQISVDLDKARPVRRLRAHFETPTELKHQGRPVVRPEFAVVAARVRDRIELLRSLYGAGSLGIDFREFAERAGAVMMTGSNLREVVVKRRSSRTGQRHAIGGIVGWAEYEGDLTQYLPYLEAAHFTGIGRHTVWGNGAIRPEVIE